MRPTGVHGDPAQPRRGRALGRAGLLGLAVILALVLPPPRSVFAAEDAFPRPPELEAAIHFWVRVYTEIDTNSGFLHDDENLSVVYQTLHFAPSSSPRERERVVDQARDRYVAALKRIAAATGPLSPEDQGIRDLWGDESTPARLLEATDHIRFQLGQSDRFREGLERSGRWEAHIAEALAGLGLPPELAVLPHVESSFNPAAHSKAGAAGLWQFMRSTGRRYMRIDSTVDDRLDPFRSTEAAAQLLAYNHRLLGTWPLAVTAYNHGAAGMRRAVETLGTDDIATIVRKYKSPSFGFASRNFYVSFLAALQIDKDPEKYFGAIPRAPEMRYQEVALPMRASVTALQRALDIDSETLRELNPALRAVCWRGLRPVPKGYHLRLPLGDTRWTTALVAQRLGLGGAPGALLASNGASDTTAGVIDSSRHRARRGRPLAAAPELAALQPLPVTAVRIMGTEMTAESGGSVSAALFGPEESSAAAQPAAGGVPAEVAELESDEDAQAVASVVKPAGQSQPVTAAQEEELGPAIGPAAVEVTATADPTDYAIANDDTIVVAAAETLGHYADWLDIPASRLRALNHMRHRRPVVVGHRIKLDFTDVSREEFESKRREYHRALEASYFAAHRIEGTEVYVARRGDSLWNLTLRYAHLPIWLLREYNPDVDFSDMRPGTQIVVPRVEDVTSGG
jgi:membrane-bound lytic murein transglycosylase D